MCRVFAMSCGVVCLYACICITILTGLVAFACWNFDQPPRAYHLVDSLQVGMSKQEVQQILGSPDGDFGHSFAYQSSWGWGIFYVYFDKNGKLKEYNYDP